jgi:hypothetical protein
MKKFHKQAHIKVANENKKYIRNDIPEVSLVCDVLRGCGIKRLLRRLLAIKPIMVIKFPTICNIN